MEYRRVLAVKEMKTSGDVSKDLEALVPGQRIVQWMI